MPAGSNGAGISRPVARLPEFDSRWRPTRSVATGTIEAVVAADDGVLVSASVSNNWPASPDGLIAIVELVLERTAS